MADGVTNNSSAAALKLCSRAATWKVFKNLSDGKRIYKTYDTSSLASNIRAKLTRLRLHRTRALGAADHARIGDGLSISEKRRALVVAVDASLQYRLDEPPDCRRHSTRLRLRIADRSLRIGVGANGAEGVLQRSPARFQAVVQQADEGDLVIFQRVADGRFAAPGVPANHSLVGETDAGQCVGALSESHIFRQRLHDLRSTLRIQGLAFLPQEARKGLTVAAIADDAIRACGIADPTLDGAASTLQRMLHGSVTILSPS